MRRGLERALLVWGLAALAVAPAAAGDSLAARFSDPPADCRLQTWFHWNSDCVTKDGLVSDLKAMAELEIGTAHVFVPGMSHLPTTARMLSDEWFDLWETAIREAKRHGIRLGFHNCPGWSSSGGPWIRPEDSMKKVVSADRDLASDEIGRAVPLPQPETLHGFYRDIAVLAVPVSASPLRIDDLARKTSGDVYFEYVPPRDPAAAGLRKGVAVDLTAGLRADGTLDTAPLAGRTLPEGTSWRLLRLGYTTTGRGCAPATIHGLECDKLSKRGLDAHWPHMPQRLLATPGAKDVVTLSIIDSYEVCGQNWTEALPEEFRSRRGYDLAPWLPALAGYAVGTAGETARFLFDFQRTVSDLFDENYFGYFAELCHRAGIRAACEPYGGPFDSLRCGARSDVPTGEFWLGWKPHGSPRVAASVGHLNGRSVIAAEAFTTDAKEGRWQITPAELRRCGDEGWLEGISQLVYHSYLHQPFAGAKPGVSLGRHGTQLNRNTTWWPEGVHWSRYVRRGQFLLQQGRPQAEVLVLVGDARPNAFRYATELVAAGGNFDYCGVSDLMRLRVEKGGLVAPGGLPYGVLYLGDDRYLTLATVRKLRELVDAGARVAGARPLGTPSLADDADEWRRTVDDLWRYGRIPPATDARHALAVHGLRTNLEAEYGQLQAAHRVVEGRDVYFILNPDEGPFAGVVSLAARGVPARWEARDGSVHALPVMKGPADPERVRIRLALPAHGSSFVVFDPTSAPAREEELRPVDFATVEILSARYVAEDDAALGWDVADRIRRMLAEGRRTFVVENNPLGGDPAHGHYKVLELVYTVDGERRQQRVRERSAVSLAFVRTAPAADGADVLADLSEDWTVTAFDGPGAPAAPRRFPQLVSWSASDDPQLKYFAGRATYEKTVSLAGCRPSDGGPVVLDLGTVKDVVNVRANGRLLGCLWEAPYRIAIPSGLLAGPELKLSLEVVNTWPNRMIGDAVARRDGAAEPLSKKGPWPQWVLDGRPDSGTGIYTWSDFKGWSAEDPLRPAGLLGPVRIRCVSNWDVEGLISGIP